MLKKHCFKVLLILIVVTTFVFHDLSLAQTNFANGWDSYFYLLQIKSYINDGFLVSSRVSLIYPILIGFKYIVGDYILAWKLFTTSICVSAVILSYLNIKELTKDRNLALLTASITMSSAHLFYFASQYAKNLLGFVLFLAFLLFLQKKKMALVAIFMVLSLLSHKLTGALCFATVALFVAINLFKNLKIKYTVALIAVPAILILFIPKIFNETDLSRQVDMITLTPQFSVIYFFKEFKSLLHPLLQIEVIFTFILSISTVILLIKNSVKNYLYWIIPILFFILNIPFIKWDINGYSFRFFIMSLLFFPLLFAVTLSQLKVKRYALYVIPLFFVLNFFSYKAYNPNLHDPKYEEYEQCVERLIHGNFIDKSELIIAHKGLAEFIKFETNRDAMSWIPEYEIHKDSLWRITTGVHKQHLRFVVGDTNLFELTNEYSILKEIHWQKFLKDVQINDEDFYDDYTTWLNPSRMRPGFLMKYKRDNDKNQQTAEE